MHSSDKIGNPVLLIGGLLAITTGLATYYLTDAKAVLGFVAGLQVSLVSLQPEEIARMIKEYDSIFSCAVDLDGGDQRCELH